MASRSSTHGVVFDGDVVIKTYASWDRGEPRREWELLTLLAEHAPNLAAVPVRAELTAVPPRVVMSRLDGVPLRGRTLTGDQMGALARAVTRLHTAVPAAVLATVPAAPWGTAAALAKAHAQTARTPGYGTGGVLAEALAAGSAWLAGPEPKRLRAARPVPVLGLADGNHANYLISDDGAVQVVDLEDGGRSDADFELAELLEHPSRLEGGIDAEALLGHLELGSPYTARVHGVRRLLAYLWLLMLAPGGPFCDRNPPGTGERQARRVLELLS